MGNGWKRAMGVDRAACETRTHLFQIHVLRPPARGPWAHHWVPSSDSFVGFSKLFGFMGLFMLHCVAMYFVIVLSFAMRCVVILFICVALYDFALLCIGLCCFALIFCATHCIYFPLLSLALLCAALQWFASCCFALRLPALLHLLYITSLRSAMQLRRVTLLHCCALHDGAHALFGMAETNSDRHII